jgi:MFS family permease
MLDGLGGAAWGRFGVVFYNNVKHLNEAQIGVLQGIRPLVGFLARPFWGWVSDRLRSRKTVFCICKLGSTACLMTLALPSESFQAVGASVGGMSLFPTVGILDAHTIDFLGDSHRSMYGSIRLWATISWGIGSVVMGYLTDHFGFSWNFVAFGVMMMLSLLFTIAFLPARSKSERDHYESGVAPRWDVLLRALNQREVLLWLVEMILMGAATSLVDSFLFVFLQKDLNASTLLCGLTVGVTVLLEIPIFAYSKSLLEKVGHDGLLVTSMFAYAVRVFGYTRLSPKTINFVLLLEVLHGITFATAWISAVDFCSQFGPKEWSTMAQSILGAFWASLGGSIGPIFGGLAYRRFGAAAMFGGAGLIMMVAALMHVIVWAFGLSLGRFLSSTYDTLSMGSDQEDDQSSPEVGGEIEMAMEAPTNAYISVDNGTFSRASDHVAIS